MRPAFFVIAAAAGLVFAGTALADDPSQQNQTPPQTQAQPQTPPQTTAATPDSKTVICRTLYHEGELIRSKQCYTQREWDAMKRQDRQDIEWFQERSTWNNTM